MEANNTPTYTICFGNGQPDRKATSMTEAMRKARLGLLAHRIYRGAEYAHPDGGQAMDIWLTRKAATTEQAVAADAVITWEVTRG